MSRRDADGVAIGLRRRGRDQRERDGGKERASHAVNRTGSLTPRAKPLRAAIRARYVPGTRSSAASKLPEASVRAAPAEAHFPPPCRWISTPALAKTGRTEPSSSPGPPVSRATRGATVTRTAPLAAFPDATRYSSTRFGLTRILNVPSAAGCTVAARAQLFPGTRCWSTGWLTERATPTRSIPPP